MRRAAVIVALALALALPAAAAEPPTISAEPEVVAVSGPWALQGTVPGANAGEGVRIEAKECRETFFRVFAGVTTQSSGAWTYEGAYLRANTWFRARARGAVSRTVLVRRRANVALHFVGRGRFTAGVQSPYTDLRGKPIRLERHTGSGWMLVRTAKLLRGARGSYFARFRVTTRSLQLRAVVAEKLVSPCFAAGVSPIIRS